MNEWLKDMKQLNREQAEELYNIAILTITNKVKEQEQQLQAYKDKEDKLREVCNLAIKNSYSYASVHHSGVLTNAHDILQILNEGDK